MQADQIVLQIDVANNGTEVEHTFDRFEEFQNRTVYIDSVDHTPEARRLVTLYRTQPTRNGNFKGVCKSALKFTHDTSVPGVNEESIQAPIIGDVSFSIPVGTSAADIVYLRQAMIAFLDSDSFMNKLSIQQQI